MNGQEDDGPRRREGPRHVRRPRVIRGGRALNLAEHTVKRLIEGRISLAAAESCTGGELEARITDIRGASAALRRRRGRVAHTNRRQHLLLGIPMETIARCGAV
ncbi:MAG: CinA family protein [Lachnospiraceae bacterium]